MFVCESNTNVHVVTTSPYNLANHVNAYDHAVVENNHPISGRPTTYWSTRSMAFCCITLKFILCVHKNDIKYVFQCSVPATV